MTTPIIENFTLDELKTFVSNQNLNENYICNPRGEEFFRYTTTDGLDSQNSYINCEVEAKFWIQYFPISDAFSLNINFFAKLDGAPIGPQDFISKVPTAIKPYEYYNSPKIRWVRQDNVYVKEKLENCPFNVYPGIDTISLKEN